jgi:Uma2 family endonuclease
MTHPMTADALYSMPDDGYRYDLIKGELRRMSPAGGKHGIIIANLTAEIVQHVRQHNLGIVFGAETGFKLESNPDTVLGPDIAFIRGDRVPAGDFSEKFWAMPPDLVVEVLSPGDSRRETQEKIQTYLDTGVKSVWIIHLKKREVRIYRRGREAQIFAETAELMDDLLPGFRFPVSRIFDPRK